MHTSCDFSTGIIIRSRMPHKAYLTLFDAQDGKVQVCVRPRAERWSRFPVGMLVRYEYSIYHDIRIMRSCELIAYPPADMVQDLSFVHAIWELLYELCADYDAAPEVFEMVMLLYDDAWRDCFAASGYQKLFICKLFTLLGIYPEEDIYTAELLLRRLLLSPLNIMVSSIGKENSLHTSLCSWIKSCVLCYPNIKAVHTLL
jgi:recombinational DNA repair protein (RecF pathway)